MTTISRLLHNHIVRYYAAWYESAARVVATAGAHSSSYLDGSSQMSELETSTKQHANLSDESISDNSEEEPIATASKFAAFTTFNDADFSDASKSANSSSDEESSTSNSSSDESESSDGLEEDCSNDSNCDIIFEDNRSIGFGSILSHQNSTGGRVNKHKLQKSTIGSHIKSVYDNSDLKMQHVGGIDIKEIESNIIPSSAEAADAGSTPVAPDMVKCLYLQMEYCETTLREFIDGYKLWENFGEVFRLLSQLLDALCYIHGKGMIHRDLKVQIICIINN